MPLLSLKAVESLEQGVSLPNIVREQENKHTSYYIRETGFNATGGFKKPSR